MNEESPIKKINEVVMSLRKQHGLRQEDFWGRIGISKSAGSRLERNQRNLSKPLMMLIGLAFGPRPEAALRNLRYRKGRKLKSSS